MDRKLNMLCAVECRPRGSSWKSWKSWKSRESGEMWRNVGKSVRMKDTHTSRGVGKVERVEVGGGEGWKSWKS